MRIIWHAKWQTQLNYADTLSPLDITIERKFKNWNRTGTLVIIAHFAPHIISVIIIDQLGALFRAKQTTEKCPLTATAEDKWKPARLSRPLLPSATHLCSKIKHKNSEKVVWDSVEKILPLSNYLSQSSLKIDKKNCCVNRTLPLNLDSKK